MRNLPTVGRIVHLILCATDAAAINKRRDDANRSLRDHQAVSNGTIIHWGNPVSAGQTVGLFVTKVDEKAETINGQAMLDGNDHFWATGRKEGTDEGDWHWPNVDTSARTPAEREALAGIARR